MRWISRGEAGGRGGPGAAAPAGVQLENIGPGHQHIDLIYFARPKATSDIRDEYAADRVGWYAPEDWEGMAVNAEVRGWCERALASLATA